MPAEKEVRLPGWWWGTNPPGGTFYAGRVHLVHPDQPQSALCGLPVQDVAPSRPPTPALLCPDCCVLAIEVMYPPDSAPSAPGRRDQAAGPHSFAEQTLVLPVAGDDGDP